MFGRKQRHNLSIESLVGRNTKVQGDVDFSGGLHVDGVVQGNLTAGADTDSRLSISQDGVVEGTVDVPSVILNGTVKGDVISRGRVELGATARVIGNVYYNLIEMAIGAEVNGKLIHEPQVAHERIAGTSEPVDDLIEAHLES